MQNLPSVYYSYEDASMFVRNRLDVAALTFQMAYLQSMLSQVVDTLHLVDLVLEKFSVFIGVRKDGRVFVFSGVSDEAAFQVHAFQLLELFLLLWFVVVGVGVDVLIDLSDEIWLDDLVTFHLPHLHS